VPAQPSAAAESCSPADHWRSDSNSHFGLARGSRLPSTPSPA